MAYRDPAKKRENERRYYQRNKERIREADRLWRLANPDKARAIGRKYARKWRAENPDAAKVIEKRYWLNGRYGITLEQYQALLEAQGGACAICKRPEKYKRKDGTVKDLSVDHNHETGQIRGLLCMSCNTALGKLDDGKFLSAMAEYLAIWGGTRPSNVV